MMANPEHVVNLKEGMENWNRWRHEHSGVAPDLSGADLRNANLLRANLEGANLEGANLNEANLIGANLNGARLYSVDLNRADLSGADLDEADLRCAKLVNARLRFARLHSAELYHATLEGADLYRADLFNAKLGAADMYSAQIMRTIFSQTFLNGSDLTDAEAGGTLFVGTDLSATKGLETITHRWPSTIGVDTIFLSRGTVPESFLRGCGAPDEFIVYAKSLVASANPIEFYSCFISYSTKDQAFADRLYGDLQNKGVRCWFAPHDVQGGRKLHEQIDEAIRLHDKLLLILSPHSMESEWVKTEIAKARKRELRDQRRVLFPIRLAPFETLRDWELFDADTGKDSAREIREYFIPDFSNWKNHDSYQEAFQRLLSDLKASHSKAK
jgi:hypothetical protein